MRKTKHDVGTMFWGLVVALLMVAGVHECTHAQQTGPANSVLRVPPGGGSAKMGQLNLASPAAVTGLLPIGNVGGLTAGACVFGGSTGLFLQTPTTSCFWDIANQALGLGTATPSTKAVLELASTTKGFLPPRMTSTQRDAITSPPDGLVIFNTTRGHLQQYSATSAGWLGVGANLGETSVAQAPQAALQIDTATRGFLGPRLTSTQRDAITTPPKGLEIFNTTTNQKNVYNGSAWVAVGSGGGGGEGVNLLTMNGGTISGSTPGSTQQLNGLSSFVFSGGPGQYVDSTAYPTPNAFAGRKCQVNMPYVQYGGTNGDYAVQVIDGNGNVLSTTPVQNSTLTVAGTYNLFQAFDCPTPPTTLKVRVIGVASTILPVVFDDVFLGQGRRSINTFGAIQQALTFGQTVVPGTTTGTVPAFGTQTLNQYGYARYGDHALLAADVRMTTAGTTPGGDVLLTLPIDRGTGQQMQFDTASGKAVINQTAYGFGYTGANRVAVNGAFPGAHLTDNNNEFTLYVVPWDSTRYRLCGVSTNVTTGNPASSASGCWGQVYPLGDANLPKVLTIRSLVPINGWLAERAPVEGNTYDTVGWRVDATFTIANAIGLGGGNTAGAPGNLVESAANSQTITNLPGRNMIPAQFACTNGVAPGASCGSSAQAIGMAFNLPKAQDVKVCVKLASLITNVNAGGYIDAQFRLFESSPTVSATRLQGGNEWVRNYTASGNAGMAQANSYDLCERFNFTTAGLKVFRVWYAQGAGGSIGANNLDTFVRWTAEPLNEEQPAPAFADVARKVESTNSGQRVEYANLTGGTCAITAQSGAIATTTASGTGNGYCSVTFVPGKFSSPPACSVTENQGGTLAFCNFDSGISATGFTTACWTTGGALTAVSRSIVCVGPK